MTAFEGWAVVEFLGHRVRYGRVSEVTVFGEPFCRIDLPTEPPTFELYAGKSVYGLRPASEEQVRAYHAPRPLLAACAEVVVKDAEWDDEDGTCGWCGEELGSEETVAAPAGTGNVPWHARCADSELELVGAPPVAPTGAGQ